MPGAGMKMAGHARGDYLMIQAARCLLCLALLAAVSPRAHADAPVATEATPAGDARETDRSRRLGEAERMIRDGDPAGAIPLIDAVLADYAQQYPEGDTRWYVARTLPETLAYTARAAASTEDGHHGATVLDVDWADAYFLKGYALIELSAGSGAYKTNKGGTPESDPVYLARARDTLERGLSLEPYHAQMLIELGHLLQVQQDWNAMLRTFTDAETAAAFAPEQAQDRLFGRAKRGVGYALIELGRLDEAEAKFRECLRIDPDDAGAKNELEYIRQLREKR